MHAAKGCYSAKIKFVKIFQMVFLRKFIPSKYSYVVYSSAIIIVPLLLVSGCAWLIVCSQQFLFFLPFEIQRCVISVGVWWVWGVILVLHLPIIVCFRSVFSDKERGVSPSLSGWWISAPYSTRTTQMPRLFLHNSTCTLHDITCTLKVPLLAVNITHDIWTAITRVKIIQFQRFSDFLKA